MRALFVNLPYAGHVLPTLGLVEALVQRGHRVTYVLTPEWRARILRSGADFAGYRDERRLSAQMRAAFDAAACIAKDFDLIVYEQFFFLGKHLGERFGKPAVRIFTSPASNETLMRAYLSTGSALSVFRSRWICRRWTREVARDIPLRTDCWLKEILYNPPELNLVYTLRAFQPDAGDFPPERYRFLGASIYRREGESPIPLPEGKPIVYISLGTIANRARAFYRKCIDAFAGEDVAVVMTVGKAVRPRSLGAIPANFSVYPAVPQLDVLRAADVFITHGGLNSVMEALYFGVPMVVLPRVNDQPVNAGRVQSLGLGERMSPRGITAASLREATLRVMRDPGIRESVCRMQQMLAAAGGNACGVEAIEALMQGRGM